MKKALQISAFVLMGISSVWAQGRTAAGMGVTVTVEPVMLFSVVDPMGLVQSRVNGSEARIRLPMLATGQDKSFQLTTEARATLPNSSYQLAARLDGAIGGNYVLVDGLPVPADSEVLISVHLPLGQPTSHTIDAHFDSLPKAASLILIAGPAH